MVDTFIWPAEKLEYFEEYEVAVLAKHFCERLFCRSGISWEFHQVSDYLVNSISSNIYELFEDSNSI